MQIELDILRHASRDRNAADSYDVEIAKPLNTKGWGESLLRRQLLGNPEYDLVLASGAIRASETAAIVSGGARILRVPELCYEYESTRGKALERLFKAHEHTTALRDYYRHEDGVALAAHGRDEYAAIRRHTGNARKVLVVGHGAFVPATVLWMVHEPKDKAACLDILIRECEGYRLRFDNWACTHFELIRWATSAT